MTIRVLSDSHLNSLSLLPSHRHFKTIQLSASVWRSYGDPQVAPQFVVAARGRIPTSRCVPAGGARRGSRVHNDGQ